MNYPLISEYIEALRSTEDNFDKLNHLRPVMEADGNPVMSSGNFAVVFKMTDGRKNYALKCFLREQEGRDEAYRMIAEELEYVSSPYLAHIEYHEKELFVDCKNSGETEFPVLLMDWVDGVPLDKYIARNMGNPDELKLLAYRFGKLAIWLLTQSFAHGDLKPDNILVTSEGRLVLVDYDGMYVPAMEGRKARELGSPDYRHPRRTEADFNEHIDDFPLASIALSLKALSLDASLLKMYGAADRLLFSARDYRDIAGSEAVKALHPLLYDEELERLYALFLIAHASMNLSAVSFRLFGMAKPKVESIDIQYDKLFDSSNLNAILDVCIGDSLFTDNCINEAVLWYRKAADKGNLIAKHKIDLIEKDTDQHKYIDNSVYEHYAQMGNVYALWYFALCCIDGFNCAKNETKAFAIFKETAENGFIPSMNNLGNCYDNGEGVTQDYKEAVEWYRKAAEQGLAPAQYNLGNRYYNGEGVEQDYQEAVKWYRKAAEQGLAPAQYNLGNRYRKGEGVEQNYQEAVKWYRKAAEQGLAPAQYNLGVCYYKGEGVEQDYNEAVKWYRKAAEQGNISAQNYLKKIDI